MSGEAQTGFPWTVPAAATAVGAGLVAWGLRARPPALVNAPACPALLEGLASEFLRLAPRVTVGDLVGWWSGLATVAAVALFVAFACRTGLSAATGAAIGVGLGVGLPADLAPPHAASAVTVALALAWSMAGSGPSGWVAAGTVVVAAVGIAVLEPGLAVGAVLAAALVAWLSPGGSPGKRRRLQGLAVFALAGLAAALLVPLVVTVAAPPRIALHPGCGFPSLDAARREAGGVATALWALGPFPLGLAAFGIVVSVRSRAACGRGALALGLCALSLSTGAGEASGAGGAVAAAAAWLLAGAGAEAVAAAVATPSRRLVAAALLAAWAAALPVVRVHAPTGESRQDGHGHANLSLRRFQAVTGVMPLNAALVEEDAATALLVRAGEADRRAAGKTLVLVPRAVDGWLRAGLDSTPVFALPLAGAFLADRGAALASTRPDAAAVPRVPSLSRVTSLLPCWPVGPDWTDVSRSLSGKRAALVSADGRARGPVVVFLGADQPFDVAASGWPLRASRGFHLRRFDRQRARDREALGEEAAAESFDARALEGHRYVARLILFRTPEAPESLAFELTAPAELAAARLQHPGAGPLTLCPSSRVSPTR